MASKIELIHGDCMEYMKKMKDKEFNLAIVDPPFGLGEKLVIGGTWANKYDKEDSLWDIPPSKEYFEELFRISINQIIWGGNYFELPPNRCNLIWDKIAHMPTMSDFELAWTSFDMNSKIFKHIRNTSEIRIHMCQKPIALYKWLLKNYAKEGDKILDTHLGSGSIAIACYDMGYDLIGYEIDKTYYDAAVKRFETHKKQLTFI